MAHLSVSCVIPTYNRVSLLDRALRSAVPQCEPGDEIIVVDDGSTDDTEKLVGACDGPVRYVRIPHAGAGSARNAGVQAAQGDLIAFLDSDDEWIPGKLSWQRAVLERHDLLRRGSRSSWS
jgi:glycosyltransferase involved in cell wall biosynthesis